MKLYLSSESSLMVSDVWKAANLAAMLTLDEHRHGSRYDDVGAVIEFNGYGTEYRHSTHRPNTRDEFIRQNYYAATWDQWGVLLSILFGIDPGMKVGSYKCPYYDGALNFRQQTLGRFAEPGEFPEDYHGDHSWYGRSCRRCSAAR